MWGAKLARPDDVKEVPGNQKHIHNTVELVYREAEIHDISSPDPVDEIAGKKFIIIIFFNHNLLSVELVYREAEVEIFWGEL